MKRFWGFFVLVALAVSAGIVGLTFGGGKLHAEAASFNGNVFVGYKESPTASGFLSLDASKEYQPQEVTTIVNTTRYFNVTLPANTELVESHRWLRVYYHEPLEFGTNTASYNSSDWEEIWEDIVEGDRYEDRVIIPSSDLDYDNGTFNLNYNKGIGLYCVQVRTNNTSLGECTNTYVFVAKNPSAGFNCFFQGSDSSVWEYYNSDQEISISVEPSEGIFEVVSLQNFVLKNNKGTNVTGTFNIVSENGDLTLTLKNGEKLKVGTYTLTFSAGYEFICIDANGVLEDSPAGTGTASLTVTFGVVKKPPKISWVTLVLGLVVVGALGGGLYMTSWLVKYSQEKQIGRLEKARQQREAVDQENLETLREQLKKVKSEK